MKTMQLLKDRRLLLCVVLSLMVTRIFEPLLEQRFLGAEFTGLIAEAIKAALAVLIGYGFYRGSHRLNLGTFFRWTGIALVFIAAGLLSHGIGEFIEIGALGNGPWTATAFDLSGLLSDETGVGSFLRAILGYSAAPAVLTILVHVGYLVAVLALYLRPVRQALPPSSPNPTTVTARS